MPIFSFKDYSYMQQALGLAEQARWQAPPNPWVGCVIVNNNQIVGMGFTQPPGQAHAEVVALNKAQEKAQGATLYVTLEPCSHMGRTPPCTQAIIQAGIKKVIIAQTDPDKRVNGQGVKQLQQAGIELLQGLCQEQVEVSLLPYLYQRRTHLPYTVLKAAISLDGRLAAPDGTSQWISSPEARQEAHFQRASSQAIVIGAQTALNDQPRLTVRHETVHPRLAPLRVLLDAKGRVPPHGPLFDQTLAPTLVITTEQASSDQRKKWEKEHIEVVTVKASSQGVDLKETWELLGKRSILQVLVEGGGTLLSELIKHHLCQELSLHVGNCLLGIQGFPLYNEIVPTLNAAPRFILMNHKKLGQSIQINYKINSF
jgi:diaminohydroxyphosphoribosylaminopyrimidine deaminase / 5-amino-6-(5-phosphoribosylamino)uracil reductase